MYKFYNFVLLLIHSSLFTNWFFKFPCNYCNYSFI